MAARRSSSSSSPSARSGAGSRARTGSGTRSGAATGSRGRRAAAPKGTGNQFGILIGGVVVIVVIVIAVMTTKGADTPTDQAGSPGPSKAAAEVEDPAPKSTPASSTPLPAAKGGKEPEKPAPDLTVAVLDRADAYYRLAKQLNDEARVVQNSGDTKKFNRLVNESWDQLEQMKELLTTYTLWLEEADLGDWRLPSAYVKLQTRLGVYDQLRGRLRRVKATRQK